jgi:hypothetical protein
LEGGEGLSVIDEEACLAGTYQEITGGQWQNCSGIASREIFGKQLPSGAAVVEENAFASSGQDKAGARVATDGSCCDGDDLCRGKF